MFGQAKLSGQHGLTRPIFAIIVMIVILMSLAVTTLWWTAGETNRIDSERTARALTNAVAGEAAQLQSMAGDGGNWDLAAEIVFGGGDVSTLFDEGGYKDGSRVGNLYDAVAIVAADGSLLSAVRDGETTVAPPQQWIGAELPALITAANQNEEGAASGLLRNDDGVRLVAISRIQPISPERLAEHVAAGLPERYLLFTRMLRPDDLAAIGQSLVVENLRLDTATTVSGTVAQNRGNDDVTALLGVGGATVAHLRWEPGAPADRAIERSLPFMAAALLIAILASGLLLKRSYATVAQINEIASLDSLSELPNRRTLRQMVGRAIKQDQDVALAFVDLDGFKSINDLYGHGVGDQLIVECASFIRSIAAKRGGAARLGGDEFALFAYGAAAHVRLEVICEALLERLLQPFFIGDRTITIGASIGLADRNSAGTAVSELMRQADVAMYVAKRTGKMRFAWFAQDHDEERRDALDIENRLRQALDREEFSLVYQPLIGAHDGSTMGYEALLRWNSGMVPQIGPDRFIPIAEDTGLIDRIGQFALHQACRDAMHWPGKMLSVNVSTAQLRNLNFPEMVAAVLADTGFPADRLMLEITETYIVNDPALARKVLAALRELGVRVALDDFGSGFASIGFLRQFTFDTLKIDRTLVLESIGDHAARAMLHSSVAVARALGIQTVAEGVETEAQAVVMRAAGCDMLQGWHFGREEQSSSVDAAQLTAEGAVKRKRA